MLRANETRHIEWHETCKCKCRLNGSACNDKQRWNDDKCRCECKELIDKGVYDKGFIWNPSNCECECNKSCNVSEYLDYENCKCRIKLVIKLIERSSAEECTENSDEVKIGEISLFEHGIECVYSYAICLILAIIALTISIGIGAFFTYKYWYLKNHWYLKKDVICVKFGTHSQTNRDQNQTYYFYNDIINIKFNLSLLKIDKNSYKDIDMYYIGYIKIKTTGDCENIHSLNPLYLIIGSTYLVFDSTDKNKEALKKCTELWDGIKNEIETINNKGEYSKDFMKIKFNTDDNLPLNKPLKLHLLAIIVRCIFEEGGKFYLQLYLDDCLCELHVASKI